MDWRLRSNVDGGWTGAVARPPRDTLAKTTAVPRIPSAVWQNWTAADLRRHTGSLAVFESAAASPQEVLALRDLGQDEQQLARTVLRLGKQRKFTNRLARLVGDVDYLEKHLLSQDSPDIRQGMRAQITSTSGEAPDGVEAGAWLVRLKSGRTFTAPFTSSSPVSLAQRHWAHALDPLFLRKACADLGDIASIAFFHNHPSHPGFGGPLSRGDEETLTTTRAVLEGMAQAHIPAHMYAVVEAGREIFLFHLGAN